MLATLPTGRSDVVVRDVFDGDATPPHVTTTEFVEDVRRVLRPGGVYLANCADRPPLHRLRAEVATFREVFGDAVAVVAEPALLRSRRYGNFVLAGIAPVEDERTEGTQDPLADLGSAALERALRSLSVPARIVHGPDTKALAGSTRPLRDPMA
ncbi:hypothetical protein GCM10025865_31550 [Paraoerskovia sediminicola]|uniref:Spermidine synthase n=1 Tax=Paraoerskovia sediminicola TaxID=1138587 RepID=A0ABN6XG95_9CELL|nr:hypothetical protein GCM10025865_31550 [Paraoerskovia sediminicola]